MKRQVTITAVIVSALLGGNAWAQRAGGRGGSATGGGRDGVFLTEARQRPAQSAARAGARTRADGTGAGTGARARDLVIFSVANAPGWRRAVDKDASRACMVATRDGRLLSARTALLRRA